MTIEHTLQTFGIFSVKCHISSSFSRPEPSLPEPYRKIMRAILVFYYRFQPGKHGRYCVLSRLDGRYGRDRSSGGDGGGGEDGVRRKGMVWRMVGVCRPKPVVVWWAVVVVGMVVV